MNWFGMAAGIFARLPIEKWLTKPRDTTKSLEALADRLQSAESQTKPPISGKTTVSTQEVAPPPQGQAIATACVPCALGHFSTSTGLLNEAVRFKKEGITSFEILDRIGKCLEEQNTLERVDLTPEKLQNTPPWERALAEEALSQSRTLRHRLEVISNIEELEQIAADTSGYYRTLNREWYKVRFSHPGKEQGEAIESRISPED